MADDDTDDKGGSLAEIKALLAEVKQGGETPKAVRTLMEKNYRLRRQLEEARKGQGAVEPGSVVLKGDDAKRWAAYQDLGDPAEVRKALKAAAEGAAELADRRTAEVAHRAAKAHGYRPTLLAKLVKADGITLVVEDAKDADGKPVAVAFVKGEGDSKTPLDDYARAHWEDELTILKADPDKTTPAEIQLPPGLPPTEFRRRPPPPGGATGREAVLEKQRALVGYSRF
jgi:DNA-binding transcriptional MerR regulator